MLLLYIEGLNFKRGAKYMFIAASPKHQAIYQAMLNVINETSTEYREVSLQEFIAITSTLLGYLIAQQDFNLHSSRELAYMNIDNAIEDLLQRHQA
jgi:hypothetical protein